MNASNELCQVSGGTAFTTKVNATTQAGCSIPAYVAFDAVNDRLFVSENSNNRVTVFNVAPGTIANGENASYVLGQADFTHGSTNGGSTINQAGLSAPATPTYDPVNARLFVSDLSNNRVVVFNVAPGTIANGENASYVLGQADFTHGSNNEGSTITQAGLSGPRGISYDVNNSRLFVGESGNNRLTVFNVSPNTIANGENASYVLGQTSFTSGSANEGSTTNQAGLSSPFTVYYDPVSSRVFVGDTGNNRVLIFEGSTLSPWPHGYE